VSVTPHGLLPVRSDRLGLRNVESLRTAQVLPPGEHERVA